jgi:predicted NBD/HSP70 family sugar kinase
LNASATAKLSTKSQRGVDKVVERIARCAQDAVDEADLTLKQVAGVGIGAPGAVDFGSGTVIFAPNLEGWKDIPLKKELEKILEVPVFVENDCNIAALGVYVVELKSKPKSMAGIFVGTGIGAVLSLMATFTAASATPPEKLAIWSSRLAGRSAVAATKAASKRWPAGRPSFSKSRPGSKMARRHS